MKGRSVELEPVVEPGEEGGSFERASSAVIAEDGSFVLMRVLPGRYRLLIEGVRGAVEDVRLEAGAIVDMTVQLAGGLGGGLIVSDGSSAGGSSEKGQGSAGSDPFDQLKELSLRADGVERAAELSSESRPAAMTEAASGDGGEGATQNDNEANDAGQRGSAGEGSAAGLSAAGVPGTQETATLDGLNVGQSFRGGPRGAAGSGPSAGSSFARGAVSRLRAQPRSFSAQLAGVSEYAAITRGAGSGLHGSAFVRVRSSALAAGNPFSIATHYRDGVVTSAAVKPAGLVTQFGGSVGSPLGVVVGSLFPAHKLQPRWRQSGIFGAVEATLREDHLVATPAQASFFSLSAEQRALLGTRGVSAAATNTALDYLDSLTGTIARSALRLQSFVRVDAAPGRSDRVSMAYLGNRYTAPAGATFGQASDAVVARGLGSVGDTTVQVEAGTLRWLHAFAPRMNNELRGQVVHDLEFEMARPSLPQEPAIGPGGLAPQVSIGPNGFAFGTPANLGRTAYPDEHRLQLADTVQLWAGRHLLSLGADWSRIAERIASLSNVEGSFNYDSGVTGGHDGGLVDWITDATFNVNAYPNGGCPSIAAAVHDFCFRSYTQSFGGAETRFVTHELAGFVEDALRPMGGLTVTLGVRYDYTLLPVPQQPNEVLDAALAQLVTPAARGYTAVFPEDRNNFGPRVAVAWTPDLGRGRRRLFTISAGYGVFYGRIPGAMIKAALADNDLPTGALAIRITPATITQCPQVTGVSQGFGYPCAFMTTPPAAVVQTSSALVFGSRFRVPMVGRGSFAVATEVGRQLSMQASYEEVTAVQLPAATDLNIAPSAAMANFVVQGGAGHAGLQDGETFAVPLYTQRRLATYGPVTALVAQANATYHAGTLEARWSAGHGFAMHGSYTYSKAIDYGPMGSAVPSEATQFDPIRNGYDKGRSAQDFPQRFVGDVEWSPHLLANGRRWKRVMEGWRVAAIGIAGSGAPYSYRIFGGTRLSGGRESINGSGGATYLPTIGRNTLSLPAREWVDLKVGRELHLGKGGETMLAVFAEAYNLLNTQSASSVQTRAFLPGTPATTGAPTPLIFQDAAALTAEGLTNTLPFGTPTSSTTGLSRERQVELGVRLRF